jgi:phenylalanyl-tRNA synthetase beta chain
VAESVLVLELNPNRPDCLGVYGVAREVSAITGAELAPAPWEEDAEPAAGGDVTEIASVRVEVPELCPRFSARAFEGVKVGPSPPWLKARLAAAGQRSITNVVDVTNYVMLMTAQPLHAFDLDRVPGGELIIRTAADGEKMTTLDGEERVFDSETVLVCDRERPSGIAGIMGGQVSEVSSETTRVLLEVATWNGVNILRTSTLLGLRSDASARFEKQLHPELALRGQRVASKLITELTGAELVPGTIDEAAEVPAAHVISLHGARLDGLLGIEVDRTEARTHLERLEFEVSDAGGDALEVTVPFHRHYDVEREVDLIEEVGRLHGFDTLPRTLPAHGDRSGGLSREQRLRRRAEDLIRDLGFDQVDPWTFNSPDVAGRLRLADDDPRRSRAVATANPISVEHSQLQTTLLGGLLDAARYNLARGAGRVALFESGRAYLGEPAPSEGGPLAGHFAGKLPAPVREPHRLACLIVGSLRPPSWREQPQASGFYEAKGVLEALCGQLDVELALAPSPEPFLHPGRAAAASLGGTGAGWIGELHPLVAREWDLDAGAGFEIDLAPLVAAARTETEAFEDVTTHPAIVEDIAVVIDAGTEADSVLRAAADGGGELLSSARVFDVYEGEQVGEGKRSLAIRLEYRAPDRTLTDEEVAGRRAAIKEALAGIGGAVREG